MSSELAPFPVDLETLDLIEAAITTFGPNGATSLGSTLDLLSGYDENLSIPMSDGDKVWHEYVGTLYSEHDLIRALIAEVRRLRSSEEMDFDG